MKPRKVANKGSKIGLFACRVSFAPGVCCNHYVVKRPPRCRRRTATCLPSKLGPATSTTTTLCLSMGGGRRSDHVHHNPVHETKQEGGGTKLNVTDNDDGRMSARTAETSPLVYARLAGLLLLIVALISAFSIIYVPSTLIVPGDATATADNIGASGGYSVSVLLATHSSV
jgi:hypothetical protein